MNQSDKQSLARLIQTASPNDLEVASIDLTSHASNAFATLDKFIRSKRSDYLLIAVRKR